MVVLTLTNQFDLDFVLFSELLSLNVTPAPVDIAGIVGTSGNSSTTPTLAERKIQVLVQPWPLGNSSYRSSCTYAASIRITLGTTESLYTYRRQGMVTLPCRVL